MAKTLWAFLRCMLFEGHNDLIAHAGSSVNENAVHYLYLASLFSHSVLCLIRCSPSNL